MQSLLPLVGFSSYVHEGPGFWCSIEWEDDSVSGDGYVFFIFFTSYFLPLGIIVFSYVLVYSKVKEVHVMVHSKAKVVHIMVYSKVKKVHVMVNNTVEVVHVRVYSKLIM